MNNQTGITTNRETIQNFLKQVLNNQINVSDIFLYEKKDFITIRANNKLQKIKINLEVVMTIMNAFFFNLTDYERIKFRQDKSIDSSFFFTHTTKTNEKINYRFRLILVEELTGKMLTIRILPQKPWNFHELGYDEEFLKTLVNHSSGLILISGPTSSGKTTTLHSLIYHIATTYSYHIILHEDPIEYVYEDKVLPSIITQREIGKETLTFEQGIKDSLRMTPDVVAIGEIRDPQTALQALRAVKAGKLVIASIHAASAPETIERLIGLFDNEEKRVVLLDLYASLKGILNQRIVELKVEDVVTKRKNKMIYEYLLGTQNVLTQLLDESQKSLKQLRNIMNVEQIKTIDDKLLSLYQIDKITKDEYSKQISSLGQKLD